MAADRNIEVIESWVERRLAVRSIAWLSPNVDIRKVTTACSPEFSVMLPELVHPFVSQIPYMNDHPTVF